MPPLELGMRSILLARVVELIKQEFNGPSVAYVTRIPWIEVNSSNVQNRPYPSQEGASMLCHHK